VRIVFDTNIYFAATRKGFAFNLLQTVLNPKNGYFLFISSEILEELREKVGLAEKQKFFSHEDVEDILQAIYKASMVEVLEKINAVKADPDDNKILECAVAAEADLIVTMDKHLLKLKTFRRIGIVHPKSFSFMFPRY